MRRRPLILTVLALALLAAALLAGLYALLRAEPEFYRAALAEDGALSPGSSEVFTKFADLQTNMLTSQGDWSASFTAPELNAFVREQLEEDSGLIRQLLPPGVKAPRVAIEGDRLFIGARVQVAPAGLASDATTAVLSLELRPWVVPGQPNLVAIELCGLRAGRVPVGLQRYLDQFSDAARGANIDVTWYRHEGNPVALMRFYADLPQPPTLIRRFGVQEGTVTLAGSAPPLPGAPAAGQPALGGP